MRVRGVKVDPKMFGLVTGRMELLFTGIGRHWEVSERMEVLGPNFGAPLPLPLRATGGC